MKDGLIISAMAGTGKSTFMASSKSTVYDSDSQKFHFKTDSNGNYITANGFIAETEDQRVVNPDFESDYMADIEKRCEENDIVFVSAHKEIRDLLNASGKKWAYVAHDASMKEEVVDRIRSRDSKQPNEIIANIVSKNWDEWMAEASSCEAPLKVFLKRGEYIPHVMDKIIKELS